MKKPTVTVKCVASRYAAPNERIVEFSGADGAGGLISIVQSEDRLVMSVYRTEKTNVAVENAPQQRGVQELRDTIAANPSIKSTAVLAGAYYGALAAMAHYGLTEECRALKAAIDAEPKFGVVEGRK